MIGGDWRLAVGGDWQLTVGDWWLVVVGGGWGAFAQSAHSARTVGEHYIGKLGIFATIGNILASMDDTTPPQCCTTRCFTPPPPKPPKVPNWNLNNTLQHSGKHMHNQHIGSEMIRNTQFFWMFEGNNKIK